MKLALLLTLSIFVSSQEVSSDSTDTLEKFNRASVLKGIEFTRGLSEYPDFTIFYKKYPHFSPPKALKVDESQDIPEVFVNNFKKMNLFVFGKEVVTLNTCRNCIGYADELKKAIFLDFKYLSNLIDKLNKRKRRKLDKELLITFAMAHEFAHIINLIHFDKFGHSVNGIKNRRISTTHNHLKQFPSELKDLAYLRMTELHAEIDFIALVITREMKWNYPKGIDKLIKKLYYNYDEFQPRRLILKRGKDLW